MRLTFYRTHDLLKLNAELGQLSFLSPTVLQNGERQAVFVLCGDGETVYLDVPDDLTPEQVAEIERVVNSHVPS